MLLLHPLCLVVKYFAASKIILELSKAMVHVIAILCIKINLV